MWSETTPEADGLTVAYSGPSPSDLESAACVECGANVWTTERGPYVAEYDTVQYVGTAVITAISRIVTETGLKKSLANEASTF